MYLIVGLTYSFMKLNDKTIAGILISIGIAQFIMLFILSEILYPHYSVSTNYISDLGVGSTAMIFNTSIIFFGLFVIAGSLFLRKATKDNLFFTILLIVAVCTMLVGVFPETTGALHLTVAAGAFVFGGICAIMTFRIAKPPFSYLSAALGVITLVVFFGAELGGTTFGLGHGGVERMIAYPVFIWIMLLGGYLLGNSK
jgi:hypothetical membrane protein